MHRYMQITSLKATNIELTDAIKEYVEKRLESLEKLSASFEPAASVAVEVGKSSNHHNKGPFMRCEFTLQVPGTVMRAEEEREDLYESIDAAKDDLARQLKDYKGRLTDAHRGPRPDKV